MGNLSGARNGVSYLYPHCFSVQLLFSHLTLVNTSGQFVFKVDVQLSLLDYIDLVNSHGQDMKT